MTKKTSLDQIKIVVFCGALALFLLLFLVLPKSSYSQTERRYLSEKPHFTVTRLLDGSYTEDWEAYIADHFPGRTAFVGMYRSTQVALGNSGGSGVYVGSDGCLFALPNRDETRLQSNIAAIKSFATATPAPVTVMVVPSAGAILSEKLPKNHLSYHDSEELEAMAEALSPSVSRVDLYQRFRDSEKKDSLYFKTDHHWTSDGAYLAYTAYCEEKGLSPRQSSTFIKKDYKGFYGTLYAKSGSWNTPADTLTLWEPKDSVSVEIHDDSTGKTKTYDSFFFPTAFTGPDPYNIYFDGNHRLVHIHNEKAEGKLLVIKDSYANAFVPFLAHHYGDIYMVDLRYYRQNTVSAFLAENDISDVLFLYSLNQLETDTNFLWLK